SIPHAPARCSSRRQSCDALRDWSRPPRREESQMIATRTLVADGLTPVRAYAALREADRDGASFLLESVVGGERWGRFSILGYRPTYEAILDRTGWKLRPGSGARPGSMPSEWPGTELAQSFSLADAQEALRAIEPLFRS